MRLWILAFAVCLIPTVAQAGTKLGFVNMHKAMSFINEGKEAQAVLLAKKKRYETILKRLRTRVLSQQKRFKKTALVLPKRQQQRTLRRLQRQFTTYRKKQEKLTRELAAEETRFMRKILAKMQPIIGKIIQDYKLDVMLDRKANHVLFAPESMDYTNELIRRYNRIYGKRRRIRKKKPSRRRRRKRRS
ncbi:MAG: OmpH family outer membrane protein [Deltaproteobacteria bacterium]|nr:MAG: OmpH family outer membrane protein [Deltaproteobacteria bacterium]